VLELSSSYGQHGRVGDWRFCQLIATIFLHAWVTSLESCGTVSGDLRTVT